MRTNTRLKIFLSIILFTVTLNTSWANLLIAPTRVIIDERARSTTINLINTSNKTTTYRLRWNEKKQLTNGKYAPLTELDASFPIASNMIRFSPRQVTLLPGQRQTIRLAIRRKPGMSNGDYRSHLIFQALPDSSISAPIKGGSSFDIKVNLGFSIPVIVRQGKYNTKIRISEAKMIFVKTAEKKEYGAQVILTKIGNNSAYGKLTIFWKDRVKDKYEKIGVLNNVAIYQEIKKMTIPVGFSKFSYRSGYIKVLYDGSNDLKGNLESSFERKVNINEFTQFALDI